MRLYREVLIKTAEQAEALPLWTTARIEKHPRDGFPMIAMRIVRGWRNRDLVDGLIPHADMIGWSSLVPFEVEEQSISRQRACEADAETITVYTTRRVPPP